MTTEYLVDIGADRAAERQRRRRILLRVVAPIAGVILAAGAIMATSFYGYEANRAGVLNISDDVLRELQGRISLQVASYLDPAVRATQLVREVATGGVLGSDREVTERVAMSTLARIPQVDAFEFADGAGDFMMVRHGEAGGIDTKLIRNAPGARQVVWIRRNAAGQEIRRELDPSDDYDPRTRPWYTGALETSEMYWTRPYVFFTAKTLGITASVRYQDPHGSPVVFGVDISLKDISDFLATLKVGRTGRVAIMDRSGFLIAASDLNQVLQGRNGQSAAARIDEIGDAEFTAAYDRYRVEGYGQRVLEFQGRRIVSIVAPLPAAEREWNMVIVVPEKDFTGFVGRNTRITIFMSLAVIAVVAAFAALLVRQGLHTDRAARHLRERTHAIGRLNAALAQLAANAELFDPTQPAPPPMLTEILLDATAARRVSLWRFAEGAQTLRCEDSYDRDSGRHIGGMELSRDEVPKFFAPLAAGEELEVANAAADPRTAELYRVMMQPLGSRSLLVLPVRRGDRVAGAIWAEDLPKSIDARDLLRVVANMMALRMAAAPEAQQPRKGPAPTAAAVSAGERSFSAELALRGIDIRGLAAKIYPGVAVMVLQLSDPVALAARQENSTPMLADAIACAMQQIAGEGNIPYLKVTGQAIVAAAGLEDSDTTAAERMANTALAARSACAHLFEEAGLSPSFRIGVDCGIATGCAVGSAPRVFNLWGEAVTTAETLARSAMPGTIQASDAFRRRIGRDFLFRPRGDFYLARVGAVQTFVLASRL